MMGCGCGGDKKKRQSSRMPMGGIPKQLTPDQRRSEMIKMDNIRKKSAQTDFQKKQEQNQKLWEKYRNK